VRVKEAPPRAEAIVREQLPAGAKGWNDALRTAPEHVEGQGQGQEDDRAPGRGRNDAPGRDEPSRS